jgi:hypothetical protein
VGPTPCEGVVYVCCTLGVQLSLFLNSSSPIVWIYQKKKKKKNI